MCHQKVMTLLADDINMLIEVSAQYRFTKGWIYYHVNLASHFK